MQIQKGISRRRKKLLRGKDLEILLEGKSEESDLLLAARSEMHAPEIDGKLYINDVPEEITPRPGEFYRCEITQTHEYDLIGRIL
jgi:ribosomal protein S12 methylthiotransferase